MSAASKCTNVQVEASGGPDRPISHDRASSAAYEGDGALEAWEEEPDLLDGPERPAATTPCPGRYGDDLYCTLMEGHDGRHVFEKRSAAYLNERSL